MTHLHAFVLHQSAPRCQGASHPSPAAPICGGGGEDLCTCRGFSCECNPSSHTGTARAASQDTGVWRGVQTDLSIPFISFDMKSFLGEIWIAAALPSKHAHAWNTHTHTHIHIHKHTQHTHTFIYTHIYTHTHTHACTHRRMRCPGSLIVSSKKQKTGSWRMKTWCPVR